MHGISYSPNEEERAKQGSTCRFLVDLFLVVGGGGRRSRTFAATAAAFYRLPAVLLLQLLQLLSELSHLLHEDLGRLVARSHVAHGQAAGAPVFIARSTGEGCWCVGAGALGGDVILNAEGDVLGRAPAMRFHLLRLIPSRTGSKPIRGEVLFVRHHFVEGRWVGGKKNVCLLIARGTGGVGARFSFR